MTELALRGTEEADGGAEPMATLDDLILAEWACRSGTPTDATRQREQQARRQAAVAAAHLHEVRQRYEAHHRVRIVDSYFCKNLPGAGAILTSDSDIHLRYPPEAVAEVSPEFEGAIWRSVALCRRADEQLSGSRQRLIAKPLHSVVVYLLGVLDAQHRHRPVEDPPADEARPTRARSGTDRVNHAIATAERQLEAVERQLASSALQQARQRYLLGMLLGVAVVSALALPLVVVGPADGGPLPIDRLGAVVDLALLLGLIGFGGMGAVLSVLGRVTASMHGDDSPFSVDHEAGTTMVLLAGAFRPIVGALFAVSLFVLIEADLVPIALGGDGWYGYWALAFVAGFTERFAQDAVSTSKLVRRTGPPAGTGAADRR